MKVKEPIHIRKAEFSDVEEFWNLVQAFATSFVPNRIAFDQTFKSVLHDQSAFILVAATESGLVGYLVAHIHLTFYANGPVLTIDEIMVSEEVRRAGIGTQLMEAAEQAAYKNGARLIGLATRRAAEFYKNIGYEESAVYFRKLLEPISSASA